MARADEIMKQSAAALHDSVSIRQPPSGMERVAAAIGLKNPRREGLDRSTTSFSIPIDRIVVHSQPREEFDEERLDQLAESLKRDGLLHPITVLWSDEEAKYRVVTGERRYRAARKAGWAMIPCTVLEKPLAPDELLALQCVENLMREDLSPIEEAKAFQVLLTVNGWSITRLANQMGISQSAVSQSLRLIALPQAVQDQVESGQLSPVAGYHLAKLEDPADQAEIANRIISEGLTRDQTVEVVRKAAERKPSTKPKGRGGSKAKVKPLPTERTLKTSGGGRIVVTMRKGIDGRTLVEMLKEALAQAEAALEPVAEIGEDQAAA